MYELRTQIEVSYLLLRLWTDCVTVQKGEKNQS